VSPIAAEMLEGVKTSPAAPPTTTVCEAAAASPARVERARNVEGNMVIMDSRWRVKGTTGVLRADGVSTMHGESDGNSVTHKMKLKVWVEEEEANRLSNSF
jgi:hypothetical protein